MAAIAFVFKKIVSVFCYPLGLVLLLLIAGQILLFVRDRRRTAGILISAATILLLLSSLPITSFLLINRLEAQAGSYAEPAKLREKRVGYIIVLGGATITNDASPADRWDCSILRVMEGVRLWQQIPSSTLVLSGGSLPDKSSQAEAMAVLPMSLGVPRSSLILETRAWDTDDEARIFTDLVGKKPFALVTSAVHMPRAMRLFLRNGAHPIPCPCDFRGREMPPFRTWFFPNASALSYTQAVTHEYVGMLWQRIRGIGGEIGRKVR